MGGKELWVLPEEGALPTVGVVREEEEEKKCKKKEKKHPQGDCMRKLLPKPLARKKERVTISSVCYKQWSTDSGFRGL